MKASGKPELGPHAACTSLPGLFIGTVMTTRILATPIEITETLVCRFNKNTKIADSGCIEWTAATDPSGYGKIKIAKKTMSTHVAAWRIANGGISVPIGSVVMHSCDNRKCVNILHLSCGTQSRNMEDCRDRGRLFIAHGESHANARLNNDIVMEIRRLYATGLTQRQVASRLGLNYPVVRAVIERRSWKHVENGITVK